MMMSLVFVLLLVLLLSLTIVVRCSISPKELEFLSIPESKSARTNLRFITSRPHVAGTKGDVIMANFVKDQLKAAGIPDVSIFNLEVRLNYPAERPQVSLLSASGGVIFDANLSEDVEAFDDTSDTVWRNHTFHGYSPSGSVVASAVYANYGRPQDFEDLKKAGIDVFGKVVIVRYGQCFRGLKVMNAQHHGAVAVIIYSDPADDGFKVGKVYPNGPWRSETSVQRGSVQFNSLCAGDPTRFDSRYSDETVADICGYNSTDLIPRIPSVPISYGDALPLLRALGGKSAREVGGSNFIGGLDIQYTVGPSQDFVRVVVNNSDVTRAIPNVVGVIKGTLAKDEDMPVLLGNHRDAWVYGAADPNSGTAALIEVAKGLGYLISKGWKPLRSIYLFSWSGEEYGLLGSTGWAELNKNLIERSAVYLNADTIVSGDRLSVSATPSLTSAWESVLDDLYHTDHYTAFGNGPTGEIIDGNTNWVMNHPEIKTLGSGSDYCVFLDHFGIASLDFEFGKSPSYGVYHSVYDSFSWMDYYGGIEGKVGSSFDLISFASKIWGLLALRLADSEILPFNHIVQGKAISHYTNAIRDKKVGLNLSKLDDAVTKYQHAAQELHLTCERKVAERNQEKKTKCNEKLGLSERNLLVQEGLPKRKWFKHVLQAPGLYLGYAAEAFPGIQQCIEAGDLDLAQDQVNVVAERIESAAFFMHFDSHVASSV